MTYSGRQQRCWQTVTKGTVTKAMATMEIEVLADGAMCFTACSPQRTQNGCRMTALRVPCLCRVPCVATLCVRSPIRDRWRVRRDRACI